MTDHLNEEQLIGYIHHTLTDAGRESIDRHLADCPACRTLLDDHELLQRQIRNELSADLRLAHPSSRMNFAAIAPQVKQKRRLIVFMKQSNQLLSSAVAIVILIAAGFGLFTLFKGFDQPEATSQKEATLVAVESTQPVTVPSTEEPQPATTPAEAPQFVPIPGESDPSPGQLKWQVKVDGEVTTRPILADNVIYFGSATGHLYAAKAENGQELWVSEIGGPIQYGKGLAITDGMIYAGSRDKYIYSIDSRTGQEMWQFNAGNLVNSPTVGDGVVYVGSTNLYAVNPKTGQELWQFTTGGQVKDTPTVADDVVYVETAAGHLFAVDGQTGQKLWQFDTEDSVRYGFLSEVVAGLIYVGTDSYLHAVDVDTGQARWRFETKGQKPVAAIEGGQVYVGLAAGKVYALDSQTGQELWQSKTGGPNHIPPLAAAGIVYVPSDDHQLYALDGQTGQELWTFTAAEVPNDMIIANGVIYFGDNAGTLYAVWAGEAADTAGAN